MPFHDSVRSSVPSRTDSARLPGRAPAPVPGRIAVVCTAAAAALLCAAGPLFAQGMLRGDEYLRQSTALRAVQVAPGARPSGSSDAFLDIAGTLSGTLGAGEEQSMLVLSEGMSWAVRCGDAALPPLGARIRVLARLQERPGGPPQMVLAGWAFASDVARAQASGRQAASTNLGARRRGPGASRGGSVDHTAYFQQYADAISRINPRLSRELVEQLTRVLLETSRECDVDPRLVMAVILAESGFDPNATSRKGAMGLGQLMPSTARGMGLRDPYDPARNLEASIRIIRSALNRYSGNAGWKDLNWEHLRLALAAYNAGSGAVKKYGGVPPYRETQNYIAKVASYYRQLCGEGGSPAR